MRRALQTALPDYMLPASVVWLTAWPLTPNGKINRAALPRRKRSGQISSGPTCSRTPMEEQLAALWAGILEVDRVGVHDNSFALGGDSIRAVQLIARVRDSFTWTYPEALIR